MLLVSARRQTIAHWFKSSWRAVRVDVSVSLVICSPLQLTLALCVPTLLLQARGPPTAAFGTTAFADGEDWPLAEVLASEAAGHQAHHEGDCRPVEQPLCGTEEDVAAAPPPVPVPVPVRPAAQANGVLSVWPKCGDDFYPIRSAVLQDLPAQVGALSHEWRTHVSDEVLGASRSLDAGPVKHLCETGYGAGRCAGTLADADKIALAKARVALRQWCNLRRPKPCKVDGVWESPSLLYVGPREAPPASADALPPGYMVLHLYAELSPLVLVACVQRSMPPAPGDVVRLRLCMETLLSDAELARTGHVCSDCVAPTTSVPLAFLIAQSPRFWIQGHVFLMVGSAPLRLYLFCRLLCVLYVKSAMRNGSMATWLVYVCVCVCVQVGSYRLGVVLQLFCQALISDPAWPGRFQVTVQVCHIVALAPSSLPAWQTFSLPGFFLPGTLCTRPSLLVCRFSRMMMDLSRKFGHCLICADVTYQHIGLLALEMSRVQELTSLCAQRSDQAKQGAGVERLRKLASGVEVPRRRARPRQAVPARKRRSPTISNSAAEIAAAAHSEVESEAPARCEDGVGNGSSPSSFSEACDGDALMPPSPDVEGPASPAVNAAGRVFGPDGNYWCKITVIRPGQRTEALSVYCSLHGCLCASAWTRVFPPRRRSCGGLKRVAMSLRVARQRSSVSARSCFLRHEWVPEDTYTAIYDVGSYIL